MPTTFQYQKFLETQKGSPWIFFCIVRQKQFDERCDAPVEQSVPIAETFRNTKRAPHQVFLGDKMFSDKFL